ncbi:hypothetical protein CCY99_08215 [Helicobacter sp. 16-1353]|uniref:DUF2972 domain-containing protein n=1 Tax=Helicobacter sp. 16-1353 TaxID=2004996 RepID=UPI000DCB763E|nr:DUF2972 domain-containing protein [Helicobacter sp. 16-1353]RAX51926.1 hypothetical protein CCY99_08215 [Helicobacter sp. 16-1353]
MINILKKKFSTLQKCLEYKEYDKIIAGLLGKKISLFTNTIKPQRYRYIMLGSHGTGRNAFWHFLNASKAYPMRKFDIACISRICFFSWRKIYGIVVDRDLSHLPDSMLFINKLHKKVPVFVLVRDPISIIRGGVNMTLASNIIDGVNNVSIKEVLESYLQSYDEMPHHFIFTTSPKQFEHITKELVFIDMNDLSSQNAYNTMKKCCEKIGIYNIAESAGGEEFFSKKIADSLALNIEKNFIFEKDEEMPIEVKIKILPFENVLHKHFIILETLHSTYLPNRKISICLIGKNRKKAYRLLKQNEKALNIILKKVESHTKNIKEKFDIYEASKLDENDIVDYFKNDKNLYNKFRALFDYEMSSVKRNAPHIVESWEFYKKFEEIT